MTCKDCIHIDLCYLHEHYGKDENDKACKKYFKNKADFVEVVRCSECKYNNFEEANGTVHCYKDDYIREYRKPNDFCSYGERKPDDE